MPLQENRKNSSRKEKNQNQHAWNLKEKKRSVADYYSVATLASSNSNQENP